MYEAIAITVFAVIGAIIWFVRLEGRVNQGEAIAAARAKAMDEKVILIQAQITELFAKHEASNSKLLEQLTKVREELAEIRGLLKRD